MCLKSLAMSTLRASYLLPQSLIQLLETKTHKSSSSSTKHCSVAAATGIFFFSFFLTTSSSTQHPCLSQLSANQLL
uniref:Uncharacterized protein n=1 Tax=Rhizophora mucronata TaxID=61149 RepID=A0A2P2QT37_RHIMU